MWRFEELCCLLVVHGTIDVTQVHIQKLKALFVIDYFSYKSKALQHETTSSNQLQEEVQGHLHQNAMVHEQCLDLVHLNLALKTTCGPILIRTH
jgi:hypothetical protein